MKKERFKAKANQRIDEVNQLKTALDESLTTFQKEMDVKSDSLK
jgi:hypothetical protein